ncbi:hypothetical protein [Sphingomonas sp. CCH5-D11]|uniref:hypothetical protein n=1 Tax=Sphingomonas sp. CCH5-D11 TaxID=1768786 RepID=UPI0012E38507|nr:hypothetical protein [Sphingomonas sp. CCH5-D11]
MNAQRSQKKPKCTGFPPFNIILRLLSYRTTMTIDRSLRPIASAVISGCVALLIVHFAGGGRQASDWSGWIFPGLMTLFAGWGVTFNLMAFRSGHEGQAFTVNYPTEGDEPERPMSPRLTTGVLAIFWVNGAALLWTAAS